MPKEIISLTLNRSAKNEKWGFVMIGGKDQALTVKVGKVAHLIGFHSNDTGQLTPNSRPVNKKLNISTVNSFRSGRTARLTGPA